MSTSKPTVGFIGVGIMGGPIAAHLLESGYELVLHARTPERASALVEAGAKLVACPADVSEAADVVFTMAGGPRDVEEIYLGAEGLLAGATPGTWLIDLTTSSPTLAKELAEAAAAADVHAFDCPVTGGDTGAKAGTLTLIAGTTEEAAAPVVDLLNVFSSRIFWFGRPGAGQLAKLCNQVSLASCMVGMADALALAEQGALDVNLMLEMVGSGMGASRALTDLAPRALAGDYKPGFMAEHMLKDITLALDEADEFGLTLPGADTARTLYDMLCQIGGARLGTQTLPVLYQEEAAAVAAGLDWDQLDLEAMSEDAHDHEHEHAHEHDCGHQHKDGACGCGDDCDCGDDCGCGDNCSCGSDTSAE